MKTIDYANTEVTLSENHLIEMTDGVSLFVGVLNNEETQFFPFFGIDSNYGQNFVFEPVTSMVFDAATEEHWQTLSSTHEVIAMFNHAKAERATSVTNEELISALSHVA